MPTNPERKPTVQEKASAYKSLADFLSTPQSLLIALFLLRLGMGGFMLQSGINKFIQGFSVVNFLAGSIGPFSSIYSGLAVFSDVFNAFIPWTEVLIGAALLSGSMVRVAAFLGALEILLFYLAYLPPQQGWFNNQIVYVLVFVTLIFSRSGYFLGFDYFGIGKETQKRKVRLFLG